MFKQAITQDFIKSSFGNTIEWYDFSLYAIFALSIAHSFFPNYTPFISLLMTFLTFSIAFIARPLGSLIFGYIGDKIGKHYSVNLSIWCMAIPTVATGMLPSYQQIGVLAPLLLVLFRFSQGISLGGQFSGLITIAADAPKVYRNSLIGLVLAISMLGSILASVVGLVSYHLFRTFSAPSLIWRVPYIFSAILFIIYLKINPQIKKSVQPKNYSFRHIFEQQPQELFYMTMLSAVMSGIYYTLFSYSVTFMQVHMAISSSDSLVAINLLLIEAMLCYLIFGRFADKIQDRITWAKRLCLIFTILIWLLSASTHFSWLLGVFISMVFVYSGISTFLTGLFGEIFYKEYRMTACSLCYSGGAAIGGFSPSIAEIATNNSTYGLYFFLLSLSFFLYLLLDKIPETKGYINLQADFY